MNKLDQKRILLLKDLLKKYDIQYYEKGESEISDAEYDRLYNEYLEFEKKYPELKELEDAPTRRVGAGDVAGTSTSLPKFTHKSPLLSINRKAKELSELKDFYDKIGGDGTEVIIEPKLDGITCNINYEAGTFVNAATRGNGYIGDLITNNFKNTDTQYPTSIPNNNSLEVRGEAIIPFDFFNKHLSNDYSNPRNAVAGIMRQVNPKDVKNKGIQVMFYDIGQTDMFMSDKDEQNVKHLKRLGFQTVPVFIANCWDSLKAYVESKMDGYIQQVNGFNVLLDEDKLFPQAVCDGLVIKVNSSKLREKIGFTEKGPKWAFAYKFKPLQETTRIDHVEWQVGKTGRIVPVAVFDEIALGGVKITRATLNNYDYMKMLPTLFAERNGQFISYTTPLKKSEFSLLQPGDILQDLKPEKSHSELNEVEIQDINTDGFWIHDIQEGIFDGEWYPIEEGRYLLKSEEIGLQMDDEIIVERSNDVIPRIIGIHHHSNQVDLTQSRALSFKVPNVCPVCGGIVEEKYPLHFCGNEECSAKMLGKMIHFVTRDAMNIVGMGDSIIELLLNEHLITDLPSIYDLKDKTDTLKKLPKFGNKKIQNLLESIELSKNPELSNFIYALSIPTVGKKTAKDLAKNFKTMDAILNCTTEELLNIDDMGEVMTNEIYTYFHSTHNQELIASLLNKGICLKEVIENGNLLNGKKFVITGTLENPRKFYQDMIEANGGKVSGSVSKNTDVVLIGADAGSKEDKARKLVAEGHPILLLDSEQAIRDYIFEIHKK